MRKSMSQILGVMVFLSVGQLGLAQTESADDPQKAEPASEVADVRAGTKITAQLESAVDARTAKPGQEVTARVTNDVKQDGNVVIRKGDRLAGRITSVETSEKADAGSRLSVEFDRLMKGEAASQLNTVVTAVLSSPGSRPPAEEPMAAEPRMSAPPPSRSGGSSAAGGGLAGGLTGGVTSTLGSTVGVAGSTVGGLGGTLDATSQTTGSAVTGITATPRKEILIESRGEAEQETGLSSALSTRQGNLRLESGTRMQFEVVAQGEQQKQE